MRGVLALLAAEFLEFEAVGAAGLFLRAVVAGAAHRAFQPNVFAHDSSLKRRGARPARGRARRGPYSRIFVTMPEPTVRPPSRMAKRSFSSMAIGFSASNSTDILMLSPGMHI